MSKTKITFRTTAFREDVYTSIDPGGDEIAVLAYNDVHPVMLSLASSGNSVAVPLTPTDAYALIDALKLVVGRANGEMQYKGKTR